MSDPLTNPIVIGAMGAMLFFIATLMFVSLTDLAQDNKSRE